MHRLARRIVRAIIGPLARAGLDCCNRALARAVHAAASMDNDPLIDSEAGRPNAATSKAAKTKPSRQACYVVLALIALVLVGGISMAPRWRRRRTGASDWLLTDVPAPRPLRAIPAATPVGIIVWQTQPAAQVDRCHDASAQIQAAGDLRRRERNAGDGLFAQDVAHGQNRHAA